MKYGIFFLTLSALLGYFAIQSEQWVSLIMIWPITAFLVVAIGYLRGMAKILGKRSDGTIFVFTRILLLPFFALISAIWHLARICSTKPAIQEIATEILIGRRLLNREVPANIQVVVDLTSEFVEPEKLRNVSHYISVPVLDALAPSGEEFAAVVKRVAILPGTVFIHCAQGHGRTSMFASLLLITRQHAGNLDEALAKIQAIRPHAQPNRAQRRFLEWAALQIESVRQPPSSDP